MVQRLNLPECRGSGYLGLTDLGDLYTDSKARSDRSQRVSSFKTHLGYICHAFRPQNAMDEYQAKSEDRTAYQTLNNAHLGKGAIVAVGHSTLHIRRESHAPEQVTAYRADPNGDHDSPRDTLILRHETQEVDIELRTLDRDNGEIITELSPVTESDTVRVIERADTDPGKDGINAPGFQTASEVGQ